MWIPSNLSKYGDGEGEFLFCLFISCISVSCEQSSHPKRRPETGLQYFRLDKIGIARGSINIRCFCALYFFDYNDTRGVKIRRLNLRFLKPEMLMIPFGVSVCDSPDSGRSIEAWLLRLAPRQRFLCCPVLPPSKT